MACSLGYETLCLLRRLCAKLCMGGRGGSTACAFFLPSPSIPKTEERQVAPGWGSLDPGCLHKRLVSVQLWLPVRSWVSLRARTSPGWTKRQGPSGFAARHLDLKQDPCSTPALGRERIGGTRQSHVVPQSFPQSPDVGECLGLPFQKGQGKRPPRPVASPCCLSACPLEGHPGAHPHVLPPGETLAV